MVASELKEAFKHLRLLETIMDSQLSKASIAKCY